VRAIAIAFASLAACWTNPPELAAPAEASPSPPAAKPPRASEWVGTYECPQGRTAVTVTIEHRCKHARAAHGSCAIDGVFDFGPSADNPNVPHGSYRYEGTVSFGAGGEIMLAARPLEWIDQPTGWVSVGFVATSDPDRTVLHGRIVEPQCGEIELHRNVSR
jgi:hypothetical protein